jgi:hypothetical protein
VIEAASRAKEAVAGTASRAGDAGGGVTSRIADATPSGGDIKQTTRRAVGLALENPLGLAIGAAALGFLASSAAETARQRGQQHGQDLAASARRSAEEVRDQAGGRISNS